MSSEFYVVYNGTNDFPAFSTMKLSDSFIHDKTDKSLETIVKVFNIIKYKEIAGFLNQNVMPNYLNRKTTATRLPAKTIGQLAVGMYSSTSSN